MDLESAAKCEMAIHDYACRITSLQLWRARATNVCLKRNVVYKVPRELEAIAENKHAATKDSQLDDFIAEAISGGDPQFSEIGLGDLHFSGETIVGHAWFIVQSSLSTRIHRDYRLQARLQPGRTVGRFLRDSEWGKYGDGTN